MASEVTPSNNPQFLPLPENSINVSGDLKRSIFSVFLAQRELPAIASVCKSFCSIINTVRMQGLGELPWLESRVLKPVQVLNPVKFFPNAYGKKFVRDHLGYNGDIPPIPENFGKKAFKLDTFGKPGVRIKDNYQLFFSPDTITVTLDSNTPLWLPEETEEMRKAGKKPRLQIDETKRNLQPSGKMITLKVPRTPNNMILLVKECYQALTKTDLPSKFDGTSEDSCINALDQNGDIATPSHWVYLRKEVVLFESFPYSAEKKKRQEEGLRVENLNLVSLEDRLLYHFLVFIDSGKAPQSEHIEVTSTLTRSAQNFIWKSSICWPASDPLFNLYLNYHGYWYKSERRIGVAAGVPAESSS